ncbi:MAG: tRNA pseudouridine(55) synthase TruB [Lachnospiraceae bacterium]|nr:tRNA pseudouridine(55) synthase TruB [Lachnospiraceae bacterium]
MNGVLNVYKEKGYTSHDVVAKLRGICHQKKIGHTGTLDPDATGVLPVCFGNATKLCDFLTDQTKTYQAKMLLGKTSDTYDASGVMLTEADTSQLTKEAVEAAIFSFVPGYDQVPPMYSAKKVGGKKLYELARQGIEIERKSVPVKIGPIVIDEMDLPHVTFTVTCSKGTYIRSLIHDIGQKLSCGALMEELVRTRVSSFALEDAIPLSEIGRLAKEGGIEEKMIPTDRVLSHYPALTAKPAADKLLANGNKVSAELVYISQNQTDAGNGGVVDITQNRTCRIYDSTGRFIGLYSREEDGGIFRPYKLFL